MAKEVNITKDKLIEILDKLIEQHGILCRELNDKYSKGKLEFAELFFPCGGRFIKDETLRKYFEIAGRIEMIYDLLDSEKLVEMINNLDNYLKGKENE